VIKNVKTKLSCCWSRYSISYMVENLFICVCVVALYNYFSHVIQPRSFKDLPSVCTSLLCCWNTPNTSSRRQTFVLRYWTVGCCLRWIQSTCNEAELTTNVSESTAVYMRVLGTALMLQLSSTVFHLRLSASNMSIKPSFTVNYTH